MKRLSTPMLSLLVLLLFAGCNMEDDVLEIFSGKTWKLTYISTENSNKQFDFWGSGDSSQSMEALKQTNTFTITFEGSEINAITGGTFNATAITATVNGQWNADGKSQEMTTSNVQVSYAESDPLAIAFVRGLQNAVRYGGDSSNLYIYYKDNDNSIKRLNLIAN